MPSRSRAAVKQVSKRKEKRLSIPAHGDDPSSPGSIVWLVVTAEVLVGDGGDGIVRYLS